MGRIAIQRRHIRFLKRYAATGTRQPRAFIEQPLRIANGARYKARMHQIEGPRWESGVKNIAYHKFDVNETARVRVVASMFEKDSVCVKAKHSTGRANAGTEQIRYAARTTAQIEAAPSRRYTDAVQHNRCVGNQRVSLRLETFNLAGAPLEWVTVLLLFRH
jgi:hypothetical protein